MLRRARLLELLDRDYLLGVYTTRITLGLVIVFTLPNSGATSTAKHMVSPT